MNRNVVDQISQQQMKREERGREKEVIHGMHLNAPHRGNDQHEKEEEEKGYRSKETDPAGQRAWLKFLGHGHRDLIARHKVLVIPIQIPARRRLMFFSRRQCVVGEIYVLE